MASSESMRLLLTTWIVVGGRRTRSGRESSRRRWHLARSGGAPVSTLAGMDHTRDPTAEPAPGAEEPVLLGREYRSAQAAEERHRASRADAGPSPLEGVRYDFWAGELDLVRYVPAPGDALVQRLVERFVESERRDQDTLRSSMTMDDLYTILTYVRRCALVALREGDADRAAGAVQALALVDSERVDWRDTMVAAALASHALRSLTNDAASILDQVRGAAEPTTAHLIDRFIDPSSDDGDLATWGFMAIEGPDGLGLIERGIAGYHPTLDLTGLALQVAGVVDVDTYRVGSIRAGGELPAVWLPGAPPEQAAAVLERCRGCVVLNARLRPEAHPASDSQQLTLFIVEASDAEDAQSIAEWSRTLPRSSHVSRSWQHGAVVVLLIARSFVAGVDAVESLDSVLRFDGPIDEAVATHSGR